MVVTSVGVVQIDDLILHDTSNRPYVSEGLLGLELGGPMCHSDPQVSARATQSLCNLSLTTSEPTVPWVSDKG